MRDASRIEPLLNELKEYWMNNPDLRLGQIVCNAGRTIGYYEPFYVEDDKILEVFKSWNSFKREQEENFKREQEEKEVEFWKSLKAEVKEVEK